MQSKCLHKLPPSQLPHHQDIGLDQLQYYLGLRQNYINYPQINIKLEKSILKLYALLSLPNQKLYAQIVLQAFNNQLIRKIWSTQSLRWNKYFNKYLKTLQESSREVQEEFQHDIQSYFESLAAGKLSLPSPTCARCWNFIYEGYFPETPQICHICSFQNLDQIILQHIMCVGNDGGTLIVANQQETQPRKLYGKLMNEIEKTEMMNRIRSLVEYLMPSQIEKLLSIQYVPIKKIVSKQGKLVSEYKQGEYVMRIYFRRHSLTKLMYKNYKGGQKKQLSNYSAFRFHKGVPKRLKNDEIYWYVHKKYKDNLKDVSLHYGLDCQVPDPGLPFFGNNPNKEMFSQKNHHFQYTAYILCKKSLEEEVLDKVKKALKKNNYQYHLQIHNIEESSEEDNRKRVLIYLHHEDNFQVIKKKIKDVDTAMIIKLKPVTNRISILTEQVFNEHEFKIIEKISQKLKVNATKLYQKQILTFNKLAFQKNHQSPAKTTQLILMAASIEISQQVFQKIFEFCCFKTFGFVSGAESNEKISKATSISSENNTLNKLLIQDHK